MSNAYEEFMKQTIMPMRQELTRAGFEELNSESDVEKFMDSVSGTTLARPAVTQAVLTSENKPDHLVTVFAGQDKEATAKMREYFEGLEPSSPSMALLKGKKVVHFIPRHHIEGVPMEVIKENVLTAMKANC